MHHPIIKKIVIFLLSIIALFFGIVIINQLNIAPSEDEIELLRKAYEELEVTDEKSIIKIQQKVREVCIDGYDNDGEIIIGKVLYRGLCYDRSLILQKIMIHNNYPIRPVYIYSSGKFNNILDLIFAKNLPSHSVFEFKFHDKWYVMSTNNRMTKLQTLQTAIENGNLGFNTKVNYIRYLSNRHGNFVAPSWVPDIYFFN
jgi:hypothetical protein